MGLPSSFVALKDLTINGVAYARGDSVSPAGLSYDVLRRLERRGKIVHSDEAGLPAFGPAINQYNGTVSHPDSPSDGYDNDAEIKTAWLANLPIQIQLDYPGVHPEFGEWSVLWNNYRQWQATEPGFYVVTVKQWMNADSGDNSFQLGVPKERIYFSLDGYDYYYFAPGQHYSTTVDHLTLPISQGMIDAGLAGFVIPPPKFTPETNQKVYDLNCLIMIQRFNPGASFDYFAEV